MYGKHIVKDLQERRLQKLTNAIRPVVMAQLEELRARRQQEIARVLQLNNIVREREKQVSVAQLFSPTRETS